MSYQDLFTEKEWRTLQCVPWWVFYTAAGTDRMLDLKEIGVLLAMLSGKTEMDPLTREILPHSVEALAERQAQATADIGAYWVRLKEVADILDQKITPPQAQDFKATMLRLAHGIADASGGFLGFGDKVSAGEKSVMRDLAFALRATEIK
jgi:hypothetical protein